MPPNLPKPPRWAISRSLLGPDGRELSRGLVDLLPFWDDGPTNLADSYFDSSDKYAWAEVIQASNPWTSKREITSHGVGWQNDRNIDINYVRTQTLARATEWLTDWSEMYVVRLDTAVDDSGLRSFAGGDLLWFDTDGTSQRMGITGTATVYGPTFHTASDNGKTYVVVVTNDDVNTHTNVLVDGVNHISSASKVASATDERLYVCLRSTTALIGTMVQYARWNRVLTDVEVQKVSTDPFSLLRRDMAIPTILTTPSGINYTRTVTDVVGVTDVTSESETNRDTVAEPVAVTDTTSRTIAASRTLTESADVTDATTTAKSSQAVLTDSAAITDSVSVVLTRTVTATDPVGVTDATTAVKAATATVTEPITTTDAVFTAKTIYETITDPVSITDATAFSKSGDKAETVVESVGVTDAVSRVAPAVRTITEAVSTTDSTSTAKTIVVTVTETIGVADIVSLLKTSAATVNESVTVIDATSSTMAIGRTITDPISTTDVVSRVVTFTRTVTDDVAVTDSSSTGTTLTQTITDAVGASDAVSYTNAPVLISKVNGVGRVLETIGRNYKSIGRIYHPE